MTAPIRITHCIGTMRIGGAEKQLAELITRLPRESYHQSLVLVQGGGSLIEPVRAAGCQVIELGYTMKYRKIDPRCYWAMARALWKFVQHLRRFRPQILHAQLYWANILGVVAGRLASVPIIITSRLQLSDYKHGRSLLQRIENFANRFTTAVFANSQAVRSDVLRNEIINPAKVHVIYNGVALEKFEHLDPRSQASQLNIKRGQIVVMAVANLHPYKGHEELIKAVARLVAEHRTLCLLLPGRDQGMRRDLEGLIGRLSMERFVKLLGERHDIPELLALTDIVVHPSHQEGFSNSILEAMTAGRPLIVTDVGGNREAVIDGINGFVVPPKSVEALAEALEKLINDSELRHRMGMASRELIQSEFSMAKMVQRFQRWYEQLVREHIR